MTRDEFTEALRAVIEDTDLQSEIQQIGDDALDEAKGALLNASVRDAELEADYVEFDISSYDVEQIKTQLFDDVKELVDEFFDKGGVSTPAPAKFNVGDIVLVDGMSKTAAIVLADYAEDEWLCWMIGDKRPLVVQEQTMTQLYTVNEMGDMVEQRVKQIDALRSQPEPQDQPSTDDSTSE